MKNKAVSQSGTAPELKRVHAYLLLTFICFVLYGNTLKHEFVLDDVYYITAHSHVKKGIQGIPEIFTEGSAKGFNESTGEQLYRPLTLMSFAIDNSISGNNPHYFHLVNLLLYVVLSFVILNFLSLLFPRIHSWLLFFITALFLAHPIHTEVVANIKSRDEILAALFGIGALNLLLKAGAEKTRIMDALLAAVLLLLACLSKESAVTLVAVLPAALLLLRKEKTVVALIKTIPLIFSVAVFLMLRHFVLASLKNDAPEPDILLNLLYGARDISGLFGTRLQLLLVYFKLLFLPYPLSWDYSFSELKVIPMMSSAALISALIHLGLLILALLQAKRKPITSFAILFYFITFSATSNFFIRISATIGERFLFLPSLAFVLLLVTGIATILKMNLQKPERTAFMNAVAMITVVFILYSYRTVARNNDWKSNYTLFESGAVASPNSTRTHAALANELHNKARNSSSPEQRIGFLERAAAEYRKSAELYPPNPFTNYNLAIVYQELGDTIAAIRQYRNDLSYRPSERNSLFNLALLYAYRNRLDSAEYLLQQILALDPKDRGALTNLTSVYLNRKDLESARKLGERAILSSPDEAVNYLNMANIEYSLGKKDSADYFYSVYKGKGGL